MNRPDRRSRRHLAALALGTALALAPAAVEAQSTEQACACTPAPAGARFTYDALHARDAGSPPTRIAQPAPVAARADLVRPIELPRAVEVGAAVGALSGAVVGAAVAFNVNSCGSGGGETSKLCPTLSGLMGGLGGLATGAIVGGVAGYLWHRAQPRVR